MAQCGKPALAVTASVIEVLMHQEAEKDRLGACTHLGGLEEAPGFGPAQPQH